MSQRERQHNPPATSQSKLTVASEATAALQGRGEQRPEAGSSPLPQHSAPGRGDLWQLQHWEATPHLPCAT